MQAVGADESAEYNAFVERVNKVLKARKIKLSATEKNAILNAISWYAEDAEKVIDKSLRMSGAELAAVTARLDCDVADLGDFGLYRQADGSWLPACALSRLKAAKSVAGGAPHARTICLDELIGSRHAKEETNLWYAFKQSEV